MKILNFKILNVLEKIGLYRPNGVVMIQLESFHCDGLTLQNHVTNITNQGEYAYVNSLIFTKQ